MPSQLPPLPPPPRLEIPPPAAPQAPQTVVQVSTAQVVSAAVQNCVIALVIGAMWYLGKVGTEYALPAMLGVAGLDFLGRKKLPGAAASALAIGATGVLSRFPHVGATILALLTALGVNGCGLLSDAGNTLDEVREVSGQVVAHSATALAKTQESYERLCLPLPVLPALAPVCEDVKSALDDASKAVSAAGDAYGKVVGLLSDK